MLGCPGCIQNTVVSSLALLQNSKVSQRGAAMHRESRHDHEHAPTDRLQVVIVALSHSTVSAAHYGLAESAVLLRTIIVLAVMQISKEPKVG